VEPEVKTPTLPRTGEEWGTQNAGRREPKTKTKTNHAPKNVET
jgi:hypothetical protein